MVFSVRAIFLLFQTMQQITNFFTDLKVSSVNVVHTVAFIMWYAALFPQIVIFCFVPLEADGFVKSEEAEESFPRVLELLQTLGSSFQS